MNNQTAQFLATLPANKAIIASKQIEDKSKKVGTAYLLMLLPCLFWINGCQHFYQGRVGLGVVYVLTLGFLGFGTLWDLFTLPSQIKEYNDKVENDVVMLFIEDVD